ncbi:MAG TPA: hypothetical protein VHP81_03425 [Lachnospiraceae bacterium]|nr:hypothetical protein [Lachnospiraceae bacterium]
MKIITSNSYNLDLLCFLNVLTNDEYFVSRYREDYDQFYPKLKNETRSSMERLVEAWKSPILSPKLTLMISSLENFNERDVKEMLQSFDEIKQQMAKTPYGETDEEYNVLFKHATSTLIPVIEELEELRFKEYWLKDRLPIIIDKCKELDTYFEDFNLEAYINQYKSIGDEDIVVYMCTFAKPYGIRLCGNVLISDCTYRKETVLANVTHEVYHPPYEYSKVSKYVDQLSQKGWVMDAFKKQDPLSGYSTMEGFIEEHIVEALGTYIVYQLGVEKAPYEYFKNHDGGSHVISPYFFKYLQENKRKPNQTMDEYFIHFVEIIDTM